MDEEHRLDGPMGLVAVLEQLEGFEVPIAAWEEHILPSRLLHYSSSWLDQLCLSGELAWARLYLPAEAEGRRAGATRVSPISLVFRDNLAMYLTRIPHLAQTSDAVNRQLSCFSSRYMNLLAVFQI